MSNLKPIKMSEFAIILRNVPSGVPSHSVDKSPNTPGCAQIMMITIRLGRDLNIRQKVLR